MGQVSQDGKGAKMPHIVWDEGGPRTCLLVKKPNSGAASRALKEIAQWCGHGVGLCHRTFQTWTLRASALLHQRRWRTQYQ